jgi:endonuclease YncB( thermonuclease family)
VGGKLPRAGGPAALGLSRNCALRAPLLPGKAHSGANGRLKGVAAPEVAHFGEPSEAGGEEAKKLVEGETVVCDLTQERTHGRRVGWCYRDAQDITAELIAPGLARDCPRFSSGALRGG